MPSGLTAVEQFAFTVDNLSDSNIGVPVIRNANLSHANNSQIIDGIVYLITHTSHPPMFVEKDFELPTDLQSRTPLLSEIVPTWSIAVESKFKSSNYLLH